MLEGGIYSWGLLPLLIFMARVADVSIGTVRVIFISRGYKFLAPFIGFFEVLIWLAAIGQIMQNLNNPVTYLAFAGGFSAGNLVGLIIAEKLSLGIVLIRVITAKPSHGLVESMRAAGFGVTNIDGNGVRGPVKVIFTILPRKCAGKVIGIVKEFDSQAFYSVEDVGFVNAPASVIKGNFRQKVLDSFRFQRKGK